jgi:hypothetical protein
LQPAIAVTRAIPAAALINRDSSAIELLLVQDAENGISLKSTPPYSTADAPAASVKSFR